MQLRTKPNIIKRIGATLIDYSITLTITIFYLRKFGNYNPNDTSYEVQGLLSLPLVIYWLIYHVLIEYFTGYTLGHFILKLKVFSLNGKKTNFSQNLKRHLIDPFELVVFGIPAIISIMNTKNHQRIGDLWAKTIIVDQHNFITLRNFHQRSKNEQERLMKEIHCDKCNKEGDGIENPIEYEQNGELFLKGFCFSCGRELITKIKE